MFSLIEAFNFLVSAYSNPPVETLPTGKVVLSKKIAQLTKRKMHAIFDIALHNGMQEHGATQHIIYSFAAGHDCVVLGAFGCGAYSNPASHVAQIFAEAIANFHVAFKVIAFAIIDAKTTMNPEGNLAAFAETLNCHPIKLRDLN